MALVDNTTYTGKDLDGFYSTALLTGDTKSKIRLVPNVKSKVKLASLDLGNIIQDDSCAVSASGTYTLAQKTLEVCDFAVRIELCAKDYETNYLSEQLRPGSNNDSNFPDGFMGYLMKLVADKISQQTENIIWNGDTAGSPGETLCDGFIKKFLADAAVVDIAAPVALSASNIIAKLELVYNAIPNTLKVPDLVAFISIKAARYYRQALVAANPALVAYNGPDQALYYLDLKLVVSEGMANDTIVCCNPNNLWYGTDLMNNENSLSFIDNLKITGQKTASIITTFKWGVEYGVGSEIVLYGIGS